MDWSGEWARVRHAQVGSADADVIEQLRNSDVAGVDVPFGWPNVFVETVVAHRDSALLPPVDSGRDWRRARTWRETDIDISRRLGLQPLSVSADRIGHAALRWAAVAAKLSDEGVSFSRDGSDGILEVYPAASLTAWGLEARGYKGAARSAERKSLNELLLASLPSLDVGPFGDLISRNEDVFDALVAALTARAAALGLTRGPADRDLARTEGWIHVPQCRLTELGG